MTLGVFIDSKDSSGHWIHAMPSTVFALNSRGMNALARFISREFLDPSLNGTRHSTAIKKFCNAQDFDALQKMLNDKIQFRQIEIYI